MSNRMGHLTVFSLIGLAVLSRWLPHPPNFSPVMGIALFAGARFATRGQALGVALLAMVLSDLWLGFHSTIPFVYGSLAIVTLLGFNNLKPAIFGWGRLGGMSLWSAIIFFVITNFGVWMTQDLYAHTPAGLMACFTAAIPFFPATLLSTVIYSFALFTFWSIADIWGLPETVARERAD